MSLVDDTSRPDALAVLRGLIDLLANPEATRELLDRLEQAQAKADEERAAVKQLKAEQEQIRAQMADEAEAALAAAKTEVENDARQADQLRARWQKKVDAIDAGLRA